MKYLTSILLLFICSSVAFSWGKTGHRVVGQIAYNHLTNKAKKNIQKVLGDEQLGMVGNYMDFIRSRSDTKYMTPWHYCTVPDGKTYDEVGAPEQGDAVVAIERLIEELKTKNFTYESEIENLKYLVHIVADIHQPLHVGNGEDKGGNDIKVEFYWEDSNLHRVWDSGIIDKQQLSYMEYVRWIDIAKEDQITQWQTDGVRVWVKESYDYREQVYDFPESKKLNYRYVYDNIAAVNERLLQAGIRLAGILNEIYG